MKCAQSASALLALAFVGCVGHQRLEQVQRLSDDGKALYAKYRQFMTELQQDEFLNLVDDDQRKAYVAALRVEERLEHYPAYIRDAIWAQDVVPGMDNAAVLLSWGTPELREFDEQERLRGNDVERWNYHRSDVWTQVLIKNGVVTNVGTAEMH